MQLGRNSEVAAAQEIAAAQKRPYLESNDYFCGSCLEDNVG